MSDALGRLLHLHLTRFRVTIDVTRRRSQEGYRRLPAPWQIWLLW